MTLKCSILILNTSESGQKRERGGEGRGRKEKSKQERRGEGRGREGGKKRGEEKRKLIYFFWQRETLVMLLSRGTNMTN